MLFNTPKFVGPWVSKQDFLVHVTMTSKETPSWLPRWLRSNESNFAIGRFKRSKPCFNLEGRPGMPGLLSHRLLEQLGFRWNCDGKRGVLKGSSVRDLTRSLWVYSALPFEVPPKKAGTHKCFRRSGPWSGILTQKDSLFKII